MPRRDERIDRATAKLEERMTAHVAEHFAVAAAEPVRLLHRGQIERRMHVDVDDLGRLGIRHRRGRAAHSRAVRPTRRASAYA